MEIYKCTSIGSDSLTFRKESGEVGIVMDEEHSYACLSKEDAYLLSLELLEYSEEEGSSCDSCHFMVQYELF